MGQTIVFITGANQGLGFEVVKKLAAEQPNFIIILGIRELAKGKQAIAEVSTIHEGTSLHAVEIDVTSDESIATAVKTVESTHGRIDVLHNNAGISHGKDSTTRANLHQGMNTCDHTHLPIDLTYTVFDVNVAGVLLVTQAFLPLLRKSKIPRVVIMSSDLGSIAWTLDPDSTSHSFQEPIYKASKAAVNMLGAVLSNLLLQDGIRVNLVNPGFRATGLNDHASLAGPKEDGALEPCRVITLGADKSTATYTELGRTIPW
jgi:NAD(P)-dependent dehydrogenase (short-subunit alcohol dehydrogenase family)